MSALPDPDVSEVALDSRRHAHGLSLRTVVEQVPVRSAAPRWHFQWAFDHYEATILTLARSLRLRRLCEIGGGRDPAFTREQVERFGLDYTINDIDQQELDRAPDGFRTACFDVAGPPEQFRERAGSQDFVFSRMVFEHVAGVEQAWRNVHTLLSPGGVGLAFIPTLYAWPFLLNHMMPEAASSRLLRLFSREDRSDDGGNPKFPALYECAYGSQRKLAPMLARAGFEDIHVVPFWGHDYLRRVPVARTIDDAYTRLCVSRDWRLQTTYAYIIVRKT